jgi:hypothetical protein
VFRALLGARHPARAIWSGLALSALGNSWRAWHREVVVLEIGGLMLFGLMALAHAMSPDRAAANAPRLAIRHALKRLRDSRETDHWPAPVFGRDTTNDCDAAIADAR